MTNSVHPRQELVGDNSRPLENMTIEIQVQTLLSHAWAGMGHNKIYKEPELRHVERAQLEAIKARMNAVVVARISC